MSAESEKIRQALAEQLSDLDDSLAATVNDVEMLAGLQRGIGRILQDDGGSEAEIRNVLEQHYDTGNLRKETYQLVKSMLDRYVTERIPTAPSILDAPVEPVADEFSSTAVIENEELRPPTADDQVQVGSVLRDRFLLQERLSGGSMGVVYKALDRRLAEAGTDNPYVAIKVLSPQLSRSGPALRALQQEAAKGRCLLHPNIVRFIDLDRDDELYFIVMEWLEGRTLADLLDSPDGKGISTQRALEIVRQVGGALDYAHQCGIVHADVKPGNVMIQPNGDVKLFDFGVARVFQTQVNDKEFDPGVLGALTPAYSSMQVLTGDEPVPSDDVFSLGCLMYRLIAGYRVFGPRNAAEASQEGMKPQRLKALGDAQWRAVKKSISYSRVTRFESMGGFLEALDDDSTGSISIEPDERRFSDDEDSGSSFGWLIALLILLGILGFAGYKLGLQENIEQWLDALRAGSTDDVIIVEEPAKDDVVVDAPGLEPVTEPGQDEAPAESADEPVESQTVDEPVESLDEPAAEESVAIDEPVFDTGPGVPDFSSLPPADYEVYLIRTGAAIEPLAITLREGDRGVEVDLLRDTGLEFPLELRLEEINYSGNRSPWATGQLQIANSGLIGFLPGQERARVSIGMANDPLREADQQSTLRIRETDSSIEELAVIAVTLEDDDQRAFESQLPANTVAFAVSQVAVAERDPAVQIDVLRFKPDNRSLNVGYSVKDVTASEGHDYFAPGGHTLSFGPGQRTARLLIPLVQDSISEGDEAFTVELSTAGTATDNQVFQRIIIMIRDDDGGR